MREHIKDAFRELKHWVPDSSAWHADENVAINYLDEVACNKVRR